MNYVTTNIRISEKDYLRLKEEAVNSRKSLAAVVREKISIPKRTDTEAKNLLAETRKVARKNAKFLKGWDSLKALREIRDNS